MTGARLIAALCLAEVVSMAGFGSFPALQPGLLAEWRLTNTDAGWINGLYFGAYTVAVPVLVSLTDRVDPRRIYVASAALAAVSSLGFALLAEGFWSAIALRALAGAGLAGTYMPGLKALADHVPDHMRSRAVAFYTSSFGIGAAISFYLAGEIAAALDWRWAFGLSALGPLAALAVVALLAPAAAPHHIAAPPTALLDFRPVFRNRRALAWVLAYTAHNWELFALRSWIVSFLAFAQGLETRGGVAWSVTTIAALINLVGVPSSLLGNEAAQRLGRRRIVIGVMSASAAVAAVLGFLAPVPFVVLIALCFVYAVTVTGDSASITAGAVEAAAPGLRGATMAVHSFLGFAGAFAGPLAFGVVLDATGGGQSATSWGFAFLSAGLAVVCGPLVLVTLGRRMDSAP